MRILFFPLLCLLLSTCTKLDVEPRGINTAEQFFADDSSYRSYLARLYAGLAVTGQQGPAGDPDLLNADEGFTNYLRQYWQLQVLTTEEAVIGWTDEGLPDLHAHRWTSNNQFVSTMYSRIYYQVALVNEFLRQTHRERLDQREVSDRVRAEIPRYRAEARFLRALSYYHGLELFGRLPLYLEDSPAGSELPQVTRVRLFDFVAAELHDLEGFLPAAGQAEYGRVDQGAVWALQSRLFLNSEVFTGQERFEDCLDACRRLLNAGVYSLAERYHHLFRTDNHELAEIIFAIPFDGERTQTWGGMTYLVHAALGGRMVPADYGVEGAWFGLRTTPDLVRSFTDQGFTDRRVRFFTDGQQLEIDRIADFRQGYALPKYSNLDRNGRAGSNETFPDTDFPLFRLGETYLNFAEAALRSGDAGALSEALPLLNALRERAGGPLLTTGELTLEFLLAERGRELHWEALRRSDLIRFERFSTGAVWAWKGGVREGLETEVYRNLFPIPQAELRANPNLNQNPGY